MERQPSLPAKTQVRDYQAWMDHSHDLQRFFYRGLISGPEFDNLSKGLEAEFVNKLFPQDIYTFKNLLDMEVFLLDAGFDIFDIAERVNHEEEHYKKAEELGYNPTIHAWLLNYYGTPAYGCQIQTTGPIKPEDSYAINYVPSHLKAHKISPIRSQISSD